MTDMLPPDDATAYMWWRKGAQAEAHLQTKGMTREGKQVYDYVHQLAKRGESPARITTLTALVYASDWPLRDRLRLAWKLVKNR